jgi:NADH:ubiquinone oxidoreductase subunit 3 (subunit A)
MSEVDALLYYIVLSAALPLLLFLVNMLLSPRNPTRRKRLPFESGQVPFEWRQTSFPVEYFPYAIIYVAYAVLAILIFLTSMATLETSQASLNIIILLAVVSASSIYLSLTLGDLSQRL